MSAPQINYNNGSMLNEINIAGLLYDSEIAGIAKVNQYDDPLMEAIYRMNAAYERNAGSTHVLLNQPRYKLAFEGDPTISSSVASAVSLPGGVIQINFTNSSYVGFRENDEVSTAFGANLAKVVNAGPGFIRVRQNEGGAAISTADYPAGVVVIQQTRSIGMSGTSTPNRLNYTPETRFNYFSIIDDGHQTNIGERSTIVPIANAPGFIRHSGIDKMVKRFKKNQTLAFWEHTAVDPSTNGFSFTKMSGLHQQFKQFGSYTPYTSLITQQQFEQQITRWYNLNPASPIQNRVIFTGSAGFKLVSSWYQELIKFDSQIAVTFTDGTVSGLNATRIFIPGFDAIQIVKLPFLDMDASGPNSSVPGYTQFKRSSFSFYGMDFTPVAVNERGTMPAFSTHHFGEAKYYYSFVRGLAPATAADVMAMTNPLTTGSMQITSSDADFDNMRLYSWSMINANAAQANIWLHNLA